MENFENSVPFDPGYSKISFSFLEQISYVATAYTNSKSPHQKKFHLAKAKPYIFDIINKSTAFYLGCMLWGGFISQRFKDSPKEITGSSTEKMSKEELEQLDCGAEAKIILKYIETFERDCKYFLGTSANIPEVLTEILNAYIEFAQINKNFIGVKKTNEVKLPKAFSHFEKLSNKQLDELCEKIYGAINSARIESLLEIGLYKN